MAFPHSDLPLAECFTVLHPEAAQPMFVRAGERIQAGDRGWAVPAHPPLPAGHVALEASTADWTILWVAVFAREHLSEPPEVVEPRQSYPLPNCRPVRPNPALERTPTGVNAGPAFHVRPRQ